jgi:hypothetical protein
MSYRRQVHRALRCHGYVAACTIVGEASAIFLMKLTTSVEPEIL